MSNKQLRTTLTAAQLAASGQFLTATSTDAGADLGHTTRAEAKSALGLGTSLNVTANNGGGTEPLPAYTFVDDLDTGMWRPGANTLAFSTNGTKKMTVLANGNVGIGTGDPSDLLHVDGSVRFTGPITVGSGEGLEIDLESLQDAILAYGEAATVSWNMATDTWTGDPKATAAHESMRRCVVDSAGVVQYYLDEFDSTLQEDGVTPANLDGTDGQVMVEIQPFYVRTDFEGQIATWSVSAVPLSGYVLHPAFEGGAVLKTYIGAYNAIVYDTSAGAYINGLNLNNNSARVNLGEDILASVATGNFAMVGLTRGEFRTLAQNAGFQLYDFWQYQAVMMLFITEYGSWNSQAVLGRGNVDRSYPASSSNQGDSPHEPNGLSNIIGNGSGGIDDADGDPWVSYRGIENIWGNCWQFVDGWNMNNYQSYVSNNEAVYADDTSADYASIGDTVPAGSDTAIKNWQYIENAFIVRQVGSGASTSAFVTDHFWSATGWRVAFVGGSANHALRGGMAALILSDVSVNRYRFHGARLSKKLRA